MARHAKRKGRPSPDYMHGYVDGLRHAKDEISEMSGALRRDWVMQILNRLIDNAMAGRGYRQR